ncbi:hypothetical protein HN873_047094 [Arachis hypogaea]
MTMMRTTCLVIIIILFFFCFAPLYSPFSCRESASLIIGSRNLPLTVDVNSPTVRYMAISAIEEYNSSVSYTRNLSLVKILGCRELWHNKRSYMYDLELLAKDEDNNKTKRYLVRVYQTRINKNILLHQKLIDFILVRSL